MSPSVFSVIKVAHDAVVAVDVVARVVTNAAAIEVLFTCGVGVRVVVRRVVHRFILLSVEILYVPLVMLLFASVVQLSELPLKGGCTAIIRGRPVHPAVRDDDAVEF